METDEKKRDGGQGIKIQRHDKTSSESGDCRTGGVWLPEALLKHPENYNKSQSKCFVYTPKINDW